MMSATRQKVLVYLEGHPPNPALQARVGANRNLAVRLGVEPFLAEYRDGTLLAVVTAAELVGPSGEPYRDEEALLRAGARVARRFCAGSALHLWLDPELVIIHL